MEDSPEYSFEASCPLVCPEESSPTPVPSDEGSSDRGDRYPDPADPLFEELDCASDLTSTSIRGAPYSAPPM